MGYKTSNAISGECLPTVTKSRSQDFFGTTTRPKNTPTLWDDRLQGIDRLAITVNAMTGIRFCDARGCMDFQTKTPPGKHPPGLYPWYTLEHKRDPSYTVLFGHWAALGYRKMDSYIALDSGCVWGGCLTAYRLDGESEREFQIRCDDLPAIYPRLHNI